jgi:hypothetical protein
MAGTPRRGLQLAGTCRKGPQPMEAAFARGGC